MHKDVRQLIDRVTSFPGVTVDQSAAHPRVYRDGVFVTALPSTPSNNRWYQNAVSALKRGGIDIYDRATPNRKEKPVATATALDTTFSFRPDTDSAELPKLHKVPTSQFAPAEKTEPKQPTLRVDETNMGPKRVRLEDADVLRELVLAFMKDELGYPEKGAQAKMGRYLFFFASRSELRGPKTLPSAEVGLQRFINKKDASISLWMGEFYLAALEAYPRLKDEFAAQEQEMWEKVEQGRAERGQQLAAHNRKRYAAKQPIAAEPVAQSLPAPQSEVQREITRILREAQSLVGSETTDYYPFGRGSHDLIADTIMREATEKGTYNYSFAPVGGRPATKKNIAKRMSQVLKPGEHKDWLLDEGMTYVSLWDNASLRMLPPRQPEPEFEPFETVPGRTQELDELDRNAVVDTLFALVEGHALTRNQLEEAWELAVRTVAFHDRLS